MSVFSLFKKGDQQKKRACFYEKWEKNGRYYVRFKTIEEEELLDFEVMHEVFVELKAGLEGKLTYAGNRFIKFKWEK
ncbi:MAG: hypothetical protein II838_09155 [Lachnospiraceae bacterium]|nr:hypothetical protein [Lachnospiraceae bacterium]